MDRLLSPPPALAAVAAALWVVAMVLATPSGVASCSSNECCAYAHAVDPLTEVLPTMKTLPVQPPFSEQDRHQLALNVEHLEVAFFLVSAKGAHALGSELDGCGGSGGPLLVGGRKANLSESVRRMAHIFAISEMRHVSFFCKFLGDKALPRPAIDIGVATWTRFIENVLGPLSRPFDPYANDHDWRMAAAVLSFVALPVYYSVNPLMAMAKTEAVHSSVLGWKSDRAAVVKSVLWRMRSQIDTTTNKPLLNFSAAPYSLKGDRHVEDDQCDKDATEDTCAEDMETLERIGSAACDPAPLLHLLYVSSDPHTPGGFFPEGVAGEFYKTNSLGLHDPMGGRRVQHAAG